ncbi:MAG TPA: hypothetical protein VFC63_19380 [Blastocatellia bacterium]|nr:hypothetical protein [Blastocatellia bacterium]
MEVFIGSLFLGCIGFGLASLYYFKKDKRSPDERMAVVQREKSSPSMNRYKAEQESNVSAVRTALTRQLTAEAESEFKLATIVEKSKREEELEQATHKNKMLVFDAANEFKLSPANYESLTTDLVRDESRRRTELEATVEQAERLKAIDLKFEQMMASLDAKMAAVFSMMPYQEWETLHNQLSSTTREYVAFKEAPESEFKKAELKRLKQKMETLKEDIHAREKRLLQSVNGDDV